MQGIVTTALMALVVATLIALLMGPLLIPFNPAKSWASIREDGPQGHLIKAGTPTMGGIMIATAVMVSTFILAGNSGEAVAAVVVMLALWSGWFLG